MTKEAAFEATYSRYPFAPLVRIGISIAAWLTGRTDKGGETRQGQIGGRADGVAAAAV